MQKTFCYFLAFLVAFAPSLQVSALPKKRPVRVQDYFVDPSKDFKWMTQKERATYIGVLYSLRLLLETELSGDMVLEVEKVPSKPVSKLDLIRQLVAPSFLLSEAQAFVPLIPLAGALVLAGMRVAAPKAIAYATSRAVALTASRAVTKTAVQAAARKETFMGMVEIVGNPALGNAVKSGAMTASSGKWIAGAVTATSLASVAGQPSDLAKGTLPATMAANKNSEALTQQVAVAANEPAPSDANAPAEMATRSASSKVPLKAGNFCLFGGYPSKYIKSGKQIVCPATEGTVDNPICKDTPSPSFLCQSMGLSTSPTLETASNFVVREACQP